MSPGGHSSAWSQRAAPTPPGEAGAEPHGWKGLRLPRRPPAGSGLQVLPGGLKAQLRPACPLPRPSAGLQSSASWQGRSYNYRSPLAGTAATPRPGHWPRRRGGRGCRQACRREEGLVATSLIRAVQRLEKPWTATKAGGAEEGGSAGCGREGWGDPRVQLLVRPWPRVDPEVPEEQASTNPMLTTWGTLAEPHCCPVSGGKAQARAGGSPWGLGAEGIWLSVQWRCLGDLGGPRVSPHMFLLAEVETAVT